MVKWKKQRGVAAVEMTIIAPLMFLLALVIVEMTQILQANNIVVNLSREGSNLSARTLTMSPQEIMDALAMTATPLDMGDHSALYVSLVVGEDGASPFVQQQHRWIQGGYDIDSKIYSRCVSWTAEGQCQLPPTRQYLPAFPMSLADGEAVYVFEVFYEYEPVSRYFVDSNLELYSSSIL